MKKLSIITFLMLLMQVAIGQIQFNYDETGNRIKRFATNAPTYSLSISSQTGLTSVVAAGGSNVGNFVVSSTNVSWSITGVPTWATISSSSGGNGNSTINVSFTANSTTSARSATLTISGNNGAGNQSVSISQLGTTGGGGCTTPPPAPVLSANPARGVPTTLTASGCSGGTITWNDNSTGTTKNVGSEGTYTATCTTSGCPVSSAGSITVVGNVASSDCQIYSSGANSGNSNEFRDYTVNVSSTGSYSIILGYASGESPTGTMLIAGTMRSFELPTTAGWSNYTDRTVLTNISLVSGNNFIRVSGAIGTFSHIKVCAIPCLSGCSDGSGCTTPPPAPVLSANPASGVPTTLTASGCSGGTITWNDNSTGTTKYVNSEGTYTATCTTSGCPVSSTGSITVNGNTGGGACVVNKVRLSFRTDCCSERLAGAKIQGSNDGSNWSDIYTFNQNAAGGWQDFTFSNSTSYTSVRFQAGLPEGYGELHGLEFYNGSTKLSGTAIGSTGVANNDPNYSAVNMMNGAGYGFWHGAVPGTSNYAGLTLSGCSGGGCTSPIPTITANPASGVPTTLTATGCVNASNQAGIVTWWDNTTGTTKNVTAAGTYTATCTNAGCSGSSAGTITINGISDDKCPYQNANGWNYWNYTSNQWVVGQCFAWDAVNSRCAFLFSGNNGELIASWNPNSYSQPWERLSKNDLISINVPTSNPDIVGCFYPSGSPGRFAAINIEEFETNDFGTDPNPSSGKVKVKFLGQAGSIGSLVVHDMMGKTLVTDSIEANVGKLIELPIHFTGMSLFTLTTDTFIKTKKVIIMK